METEAKLDSPSSVSKSECSGAGGALSAAERARAERQRLRARELRAARLASGVAVEVGSGASERLVDTGGGFLLPAATAPAAPRPAPPPPAPPAHRSEWPPCEECGARIATSTLLEQFSLAVCDACRQPEGEHALLTRTEAKSEFLLKDCDLDLREPPLRCVRRRNPHARAGSDMRLYVRSQVAARAALVWGGEHGLEAERARRDQKRAESRALKYSRELRALRRGVRPAPRVSAAHTHEWTDERVTADEDVYQHTCTHCGLTQTFEKM